VLQKKFYTPSEVEMLPRSSDLLIAAEILFATLSLQMGREMMMSMKMRHVRHEFEQKLALFG
jgi:hypothetical protein